MHEMWFGRVVSRDDEEQVGRLQVRCFGFHPDTVPDEELPWATVIQPVYSAAQGGVGRAAVGAQVGSIVFGTFVDIYRQELVVFGTLAGRGDMPPEAAAAFPHNAVWRYEGGQVVEIDSSPDNKRIIVKHPAGTSVEVDNDGNVFVQAANVSLVGQHVYTDADRRTTIVGEEDVLQADDLIRSVRGNALMETENLAVSARREIAITADRLDITADRVEINATRTDINGQVYINGRRIDD